MTDRLTELEWLIRNETDRDIRAANIREFNRLWEERNGGGDKTEGSGATPAKEPKRARV